MNASTMMLLASRELLGNSAAEVVKKDQVGQSLTVWYLHSHYLWRNKFVELGKA